MTMAAAKTARSREARSGQQPTAQPRKAPSKSRETAKQETREALIRAGMDLFGEQGLDTPSLDAICERAGFTRGAFYVHFRDRDDFLEAVMQETGASFLDAVLGTGDAGD